MLNGLINSSSVTDQRRMKAEQAVLIQQHQQQEVRICQGSCGYLILTLNWIDNFGFCRAIPGLSGCVMNDKQCRNLDRMIQFINWIITILLFQQQRVLVNESLETLKAINKLTTSLVFNASKLPLNVLVHIRQQYTRTLEEINSVSI